MSEIMIDEFLSNNYPITENLLSQLSLDTLLTLCATNTSVNLLCQSDFIWRQRTEIEFPDELRNIPPDVTWKDHYIYLHGTIGVKEYRDNILIKSSRVIRLNFPDIIIYLPDGYAFCADDQNRIIGFMTPIKTFFQLINPMPRIKNIYIFKSIDNELFNFIRNYIAVIRARGRQIPYNGEIINVNDELIKELSELLSQELTDSLLR